MDARQALVVAAEEFLARRQAGGDLAAARETLADAIRHALVERLVARAPRALAEDLAQEKTLKVLAAVENDRTTAERLPSYVAAAADNAHRSHRRSAASQREVTDLAEVDVPADPSPSPEEQVAVAQTAQDQSQRVEALLAEMPATYRDVLTRHYREDVSINDLVESEITTRLAQENRPTDDPVARDARRRNARETVDQRLSRARAWLAKRLDPSKRPL